MCVCVCVCVPSVVFYRQVPLHLITLFLCVYVRSWGFVCHLYIENILLTTIWNGYIDNCNQTLITVLICVIATLKIWRSNHKDTKYRKYFDFLRPAWFLLVLLLLLLLLLFFFVVASLAEEAFFIWHNSHFSSRLFIGNVWIKNCFKKFSTSQYWYHSLIKGCKKYTGYHSVNEYIFYRYVQQDAQISSNRVSPGSIPEGVRIGKFVALMIVLPPCSQNKWSKTHAYKANNVSKIYFTTLLVGDCEAFTHT